MMLVHLVVSAGGSVTADKITTVITWTNPFLGPMGPTLS